MPRAVQITVPTAQADGIIEQIRAIEELIGLRIQRQISLKPPGDLISLGSGRFGLAGTAGALA